MAQEWTEKKKLGVTLASMVLVNAGIFGFLFFKVKPDWEKLDKKLKQVSAEVDGLIAKAKDRPELERQLTVLKRENEQREQMLPELHEREKFIDVLSDRANDTKISAKTVNPVYDQLPNIDGVSEQNFKRDIWRTTYSADFKGLVQFFNLLEEHYHRFVRIQNVRITAKGGGMETTSAQHEVSFDVETFRYIKQSGAGF